MITKKELQIFNKPDRVLVRANDFIYLLPDPALRSLISNYTITFPNRNIISENYTVLPHGSATLVFSRQKDSIYGSLFGPSTKPCKVGGHANQCDMLFIIEFQPAGLYLFTGIHQKELADHTFPFELINAMLNKLVKETLDNAPTIDELILTIDKLFLSNMHSAYPSYLQLATQTIIKNIGNISQKELSNTVYYSERHLNRIFDQYLGMNIKTFSRMVRINKALRLLQNPHNNLTFVSNTTEFYDLPHFFHDFKSVCGLTPQEYRSSMSDFYNEISKF